MQRVTTRHSNERNPMTTKAEFRAAVRRRLDDVPVAGLWDDATLDDAMADALSRYGVFAPQEERSTVAVSDGAMSFAVTGLERGQAIRRVIDPGAGVIAPGRAEGGDEPGQGGPGKSDWRNRRGPEAGLLSGIGRDCCRQPIRVLCQSWRETTEPFR